MLRPSFACLVSSSLLVLAACGGGGGGGGDAPPVSVSAGPDRTVAASTPIALVAAAPPGSGVASFNWSQVGGNPVALDSASGGAEARFVSPDRDERLQFEVTGRDASGGFVALDRVVIDVAAVRPEVSAEARATIEVRGGGPGRAVASALHAATSRLFVVDSVAGDVVVYDVSNPASPSFAGAVLPPDPAPGFVPGPALAVACGEDGAVAITYSGETTEFPGRIQFVEPSTLVEAASISSFGANPVDATATPDGATFAFACAGDAPFVGGGNGRGYVVVVRIPAAGPGAIEVHRDVSPIPFNTLDGREDDLEAAGVRLFRSNPTASIELVPRAVALSPDGSLAWAACPENDALLVVDTRLEIVVDCVSLGDRSWGTFDGGTSVEVVRARWDDPPTDLTTPAGDEIPLGGVTGIASVTELADGTLAITAVNGAGPALAPFDAGGDGTLDLPLVDPARALRVRRILVDPATGAVTSDVETPLEGDGGTPVMGAPSQFASAPGLAFHDESVVDLDGQSVPASPLGARFLGAALGPGGELWLADARRCGIWRFDPQGRLLARFVPEGTPSSLGQATLPPAYARRRANLSFPLGRRFGGFGALAYDGARDLLVAATRLPLDNPDSPTDSTSSASRIARLLEVDPSSGAPVGEYVVVLDAAEHAIEGLAASTNGAFDGGLAMLEAALDPSGFRGVYAIDVSEATNLRSLSPVDYASVDAALEVTAPADLDELVVAVVPVAKRLRADLTDAGLGGAGRPSGLAALDADLVVSFDDGATVEQASVDPSTGRLLGVAAPATSIARVTLSPAGIDAASTGSEFAPRDLPLQGLVQPLDLVAYDDEGQARIALANGGFARVLDNMAGQPAFDERARVADLTLDTLTFPNAVALQLPSAAGELLVSDIGADVGGDGLVDRLQAFGARSIGLRDERGAPVWSSGERLVARASLEAPGRVRAAATTSGIEPRALALGTLTGRPVLVSALRGAGLVVVHDLSDASAPLFAGVLLATDDPVDVDVAGATLATTDATRGRVLLHRLTRD